MIRYPGPLSWTARSLEARLKFLFDERYFRHRYIPAQLDAAAWARLVDMAPFVGIGFAGIKPDPKIGRTLEASSEWTIFLVSKNVGDVRARFLGDALLPGAFDFLQVAIVGLQGWTLPKSDNAWENGGTVQITGVHNAAREGATADACTILAIDLSIRFEAVPSPEMVTLAGETTGTGPITLAVAWDFDGATQLADQFSGAT